jgi:hypothetical protein
MKADDSQATQADDMGPITTDPPTGSFSFFCLLLMT